MTTPCRYCYVQGLSQLQGSEPPAPIPMPSETLPGQSLSSFSAEQQAPPPQQQQPPQAPSSYSQAAADEQKSQLNPNANIFSSMYGGPSGGGQDPAAFGDFDHRRPIDKDGFQTQGESQPPLRRRRTGAVSSVIRLFLQRC